MLAAGFERVLVASSDASTCECKVAEDKTKKEALRALKRRIGDAVWHQLQLDLPPHRETGPGGHSGTSLTSSVAGSAS
jgi:hypothetical protein